MKKVYIVDEYVSSQSNGVGTYIKEVITILTNFFKAEVTLIDLNSPSKKFKIKAENTLNRICIPKGSNYFLDNSFVVTSLLKLYIEDSKDNIFLVNHSPSWTMAETIKRYFPLSKIIHVIHNFPWSGYLLGDKDKFINIVESRDKEDIQTESDKIFLDTFDKYKEFYGLFDQVVCLSQSANELLRDRYNIEPNKIFYTPNFLTDRKTEIDIEERKTLRHTYGINDDKIIISVGRVTKEKGALSLIRSFKKVLEKEKKARLVLIGNISKTEEIFAECRTISSRINFMGTMPFEETQKWYQMADIGVIPSYTEQCSYVGIEMLMHALPIVASDGFGVNEMFQDGINACVAHIDGDGEEYEKNLADSILKLLSSEELCSTLRAEARKTYLDKYHIKQAAANYKKLFENL